MRGKRHMDRDKREAKMEAEGREREEKSKTEGKERDEDRLRDKR